MTPPHVHDKGLQAELLSSVLWMVSSFARKDLSKFYTGFLPIGSGMQSQRWNLSQETRMFWLLLNEDLSPWTCDLVVLQYVLEVDICAWSWGRSEEEKTTTIHFFENWMIVIVNYQFCFINFEVHFFQTLLKLKTEYRKQQHCKNKLQGEIDN